jgi:subtilisin family serine protease
MRRIRTRPAHVAVLVFSVVCAFALLAAPAFASSSDAAAAKRLLLVRFKPQTPARAVTSTLRTAHVTRAGQIRRLHVLVVRVEARHAVTTSLAMLRRSSKVAYVARKPVPAALRTTAESAKATAAAPAPAVAAAPAAAIAAPNDPSWSQQWSLSKLHLPAAWAAAPESPIVVATVDGGVNGAQPDLAGAFTSGYDFVNHDDNPTDDNGHGTAVAGIIAARTGNGTGVAGICPRCTIMPVKVSDSAGRAWMSDVAAGIAWAADHGARVINVSIGGQPSDDLASAVRYAHDRGIVIVAAAGNGGSADPVYPAAYPEVISVAGTDENDRLYNWSTFGSWVRAAAPGCNTTTMMGGGYDNFCGTSSASPVVAGLAGLALSVAPNASAAAVEHALLASQTRVPGTGVPRVDALATVNAILGR